MFGFDVITQMLQEEAARLSQLQAAGNYLISPEVAYQQQQQTLPKWDVTNINFPANSPTYTNTINQAASPIYPPSAGPTINYNQSQPTQQPVQQPVQQPGPTTMPTAAPNWGTAGNSWTGPPGVMAPDPTAVDPMTGLPPVWRPSVGGVSQPWGVPAPSLVPTGPYIPPRQPGPALAPGPAPAPGPSGGQQGGSPGVAAPGPINPGAYIPGFGGGGIAGGTGGFGSGSLAGRMWR